MNNLLKVALTHDSYTHVMLRTKYHGHSNHIYLGHAMDDIEVHYTLDALLEEWDYPELSDPIMVYRQVDGHLQEDEIVSYDVSE